MFDDFFREDPPAVVEPMIKDNVFPLEFIELNGKSVNIYEAGVRIADIIDYFKARIPWGKVVLSGDLTEVRQADEEAQIKYITFNRLLNIWVEMSDALTSAFKRPGIVGKEVEPTIH